MNPRIRIQKIIYGFTTLVSLCIFKPASLLMSHTDTCVGHSWLFALYILFLHERSPLSASHCMDPATNVLNIDFKIAKYPGYISQCLRCYILCVGNDRTLSWWIWEQTVLNVLSQVDNMLHTNTDRIHMKFVSFIDPIRPFSVVKKQKFC